jgi:hypothetical protein
MLEREPDWTALPSGTAAVGRVLQRCLEKDPRRRLCDIADVGIQIDDAFATPTPAPPSTPSQRRVSGAAWAVAAAAALAVGAGAAFLMTRAPREAATATRLSLSAPGVITPQTSVAVSPERGVRRHRRQRPIAALDPRARLAAAAIAARNRRRGAPVLVNASLRNLQLNWTDRSGRAMGSLGSPDRYSIWPELSAGGSRVAIARGGTADPALWLLNVAGGAAARLTLQPNVASHAMWSPDDRRILYGVAPSPGVMTISAREVDGGSEQELGSLSGSVFLWDWSPDGRFLVYSPLSAEGVSDLWVLPLDGDRKPFPIAQSRFHKTQAQISPDGRWIAFASYESGRDEVYVQSFPQPGNRRQVSTAGGMQPRWRADGRELFYLAADQQMMAIPLKHQASFEAGLPTPLFRTRLIPQGSQSTWFDTAYDVSPDGQRFLFTGPPDDPAPPMTVVLNWPAALRR